MNSKKNIISENGLNMIAEVSEERDIWLLHFSSLPFKEDSIEEKQKVRFRMVEIQATGENQNDHHGSKHTGCMPGYRLLYKQHIAKEGFKKWDEKCKIYIPHNSWMGEVQWRNYSLPELGLNFLEKFTSKRVSCGSTGTWSSSEYLPMGCFENCDCGNMLFWQIEHNGSWHWEISDMQDHLYLQLSGPSENENHWWKNLNSGERFISIPVTVGSVNGGFEKAIEELTRYRRAIRRENDDNKKLPIIFNDYMNCLFGNPTTERLIPLIDAAAEAG